MLRKLLDTELEYEKKLLSKLTSDDRPFHGAVLRSSRGFFYYKTNSKTKKRYIRRSDTDILRRITSCRFFDKKAEILASNIKALENALKKLRDYDDEAIIGSLPNVYREAIEHLKRTGPVMKEGSLRHDAGTPVSGVIQSENLFKAGELSLTASNGLKVRSREELIIAELLISLGINFRYEKALTLRESVAGPDGTVIYRNITIYPDFTIILTDGTELFWEHAGRLDLEKYRKKFSEKLKIYSENGIFSPGRLMITTSGPGEAIDLPFLKHFIMTQILPFC